jgi:hypothetical protein
MKAIFSISLANNGVPIASRMTFRMWQHYTVLQGCGLPAG